MKRTRFYLFLFCSLLFVCCGGSADKREQPILKGPYLGQKPPGKIAEVFAPGIVSTEKNEGFFGFFNSGKLFLFSRTDPDFTDWKNEPVYVMEMKDGLWTKPRLSPYVGKPWYLDLEPFPPGKILYFARWGGDGEVVDSASLDIWEVHGTADGWSEPRKLPPPVNSETIDTMPTASRDGTLYFFSGRKGGVGGDDIYRSRPVDGKHVKVENLGPAVNSVHNDIDSFISPDGDFLIFCSRRPDGLGGIDMYVSFQNKDGSWTQAENLGEGINSTAYDWIPFITDDGKYLFFISNRSGNYDIYWVDAKIIDELKPKDL